MGNQRLLNTMTISKCLWITPKEIFPIRDGARVANHSLLKSLRPFFGELDLLMFEEGEDTIEGSYKLNYQEDFNPTKIIPIKRASFKNIFAKLVFLSLNFLRFPNLPVTTGYFNSALIRYKVKNILQNGQYDLIVFDGLHPYSVFMDFLDSNQYKNTKVIYRAHNVEHNLWFTSADKTQNKIIAALLKWQGQKMEELEVKLLKRAHIVWPIAAEDLNVFLKLVRNAKFSLVPVGLNFTQSQLNKTKTSDQKIKLLFLGKMDWAPNKDGLKWFLLEVWPFINHEKYELHIVGSGDSSWGTHLFESEGIKFFGFVDDINAVYAECDFSIIPIRFGSGTRIKVIESVSKGMPIISTHMGVQGSGLLENDYFHAETAADWIGVINQLDQAVGLEKAQQAFSHLQLMYSPIEIAQRAYLTLS